MPRIDIKYKKDNEEYEIHANGWFIGSLKFTNMKQLSRFIKEYEK